VDDFQLAYAEYVIRFPDLASLGVNAATWLAEYNRVKASGLSATLLVNTAMEGGAAGAVRNFDQKLLLSALHARRGKLDAAYLSAITEPAPNLSQPAGSVIRLGP
jgi:hypothetical protein